MSIHKRQCIGVYCVQQLRESVWFLWGRCQKGIDIVTAVGMLVTHSFPPPILIFCCWSTQAEMSVKTLGPPFVQRGTLKLSGAHSHSFPFCLSICSELQHFFIIWYLLLINTITSHYSSYNMMNENKSLFSWHLILSCICLLRCYLFMVIFFMWWPMGRFEITSYQFCGLYYGWKPKPF